MVNLLPCQTHVEDVRPVFRNGVFGIYYECPVCLKKSGAWSDDEAAVEAWNLLNGRRNIIARDMVYPVLAGVESMGE